MRYVVLLFLLFMQSAWAQTFVLNELVTKTVPGIGSTESYTFPTGIPDAGVYTCLAYAISQFGATSAASNVSIKTTTIVGPQPITFTFEWPSLYTNGNPILVGEVRTARLTCELTSPPANPIPEAGILTVS